MGNMTGGKGRGRLGSIRKREQRKGHSEEEGDEEQRNKYVEENKGGG